MNDVGCCCHGKTRKFRGFLDGRGMTDEKMSNILFFFDMLGGIVSLGVFFGG